MDGLTYALSRLPRRVRWELWLIDHLLMQGPYERALLARWGEAVTLYREKPPTIDAVQYVAPSTANLTAFGVPFTHGAGTSLVVSAYPGAGAFDRFTVEDGDWIKKADMFSRIPGDEFAGRYELAP